MASLFPLFPHISITLVSSVIKPSPSNTMFFHLKTLPAFCPPRPSQLPKRSSAPSSAHDSAPATAFCVARRNPRQTTIHSKLSCLSAHPLLQQRADHHSPSKPPLALQSTNDPVKNPPPSTSLTSCTNILLPATSEPQALTSSPLSPSPSMRAGGDRGFSIAAPSQWNSLLQDTSSPFLLKNNTQHPPRLNVLI